MDYLLPSELTQGATLRDREYAWSIPAFPAALERAPKLGFACLGGQFQLRSEEGTIYEFYWAEANSADRGPEEPWDMYAKRSCSEVSEGFQALLKGTDFNAEARKFDSLESASLSDSEISRQLVFCAYFVNEEDLPV